MHQDAHEFFNYLMNEVSEDVKKRQVESKKKRRKFSQLLLHEDREAKQLISHEIV